MNTEENVTHLQESPIALRQSGNGSENAEAEVQAFDVGTDLSLESSCHSFKDKNELYLWCVSQCFQALSNYLRGLSKKLKGTPEQQLKQYFEARLQFFVKNPLYLGIFTDVTGAPPKELADKIASCRKPFDEMNTELLTSLLKNIKLRRGMVLPKVVESFELYLEFVRSRFQSKPNNKSTPEETFKEYEEICRRQVDIMLHGVVAPPKDDEDT